MTDLPFAGQGMHMLGGVLVAEAPDSLEDAALRQFQSGLLHRVHDTSPRAVVIDVSRVRLLDSISYSLLADAGRMAAMLGAKVVFAGFQPGVVSTLMDLDVDTGSLVTALGLEEAMDLLRPAAQASPEGEATGGTAGQDEGQAEVDGLETEPPLEAKAP